MGDSYNEALRKIHAEQDSIDPRIDLANLLMTEASSHIGKPPEFFIGMRSGWNALDTAIKGFHPECFYVVGGATGSGKTSFVTSLTGKMMKARRHRVVFISTELNLMNIYKQVCESFAMGTPFAPNGRTLGRDERDRLEVGVQHVGACIKSGMLHIVHVKSVSMTDISMAMAECMGHEPPYTDDPPLVIIDQASRVKRTSEENSFHMKTEDMVREMEALAGDAKIPLILVTQLNRAAEHQDRPRMSNFKHSAAFEEYAHTAIILEKLEHDHAKVWVDKARMGMPRELLAHFYGESHTWDID